MSVQSNITRIEGGKASLKTSINNKLNSTQQKITNEHIEDYHLFVDQISGGGGVGTLEIYENGVYDVSDYANVYVKITELVPCTSISFNKSESTILPDETDTIIATYTPTETTDAIVWNSDNVTVATVTRVAGTDSAVITYVGAGTCHITATCGSFSVSCTVTCDSGEIHCTSITLDQHTLTLDEPVQEKPCTAITLDKSTASVGTGETVTVTATLTPSDTTDTLTVTSSDTTKATVTLSGNVATITGVADGSSNITFTCGDISEVCVCTVSAGLTPISTVNGKRCNSNSAGFGSNSNMSVNFYQITPGDSYEITCPSRQLGTSWGDCTTTSGTNEDFAYYENGNKLRIHTTNTPHYLAVSTFTSDIASVTVTRVETVPCTGIAFDPASVTFTEVGAMKAFTTTLTPSDTTDVIHFTNSDSTKVNLTTAYYKDGQVKAVADGSAVITATCGNATATMNVTVSTGRNPVPIITYEGKRVNGTTLTIDTQSYVKIYRINPGDALTINASAWGAINASWGTDSTGMLMEDSEGNGWTQTLNVTTSATSTYLAVSVKQGTTLTVTKMN